MTLSRKKKHLNFFGFLLEFMFMQDPERQSGQSEVRRSRAISGSNLCPVGPALGSFAPGPCPAPASSTV